MSKKSKSKALNKRRAKKREKKRIASIPRRAKYLRSQANKKSRKKQLQATLGTLTDGVQLPEMSDDDYTFWLCHGVNYLLSDAETGLWEPMFEAIYGGRLPDPAMIPNKVMARFPDAFGEDGDLSGLPMVVLAWTITEKSTMRIYRHEAESRVRRTHGEDLDAEAVARQPYQPQVWDLLNQVKARSIAVGEDAEETAKEATPDEES